ADHLFIGRDVHTIDRVAGHVAVHPLNAGAHRVQHFVRFLSGAAELLRPPASTARNVPFDDVLGHRSLLVEIAGASATGVIDIDDLQFGVDIDRDATHFPQPHPGGFHPPERDVRLAADGRRVDVDDTGHEVVDE